MPVTKNASKPTRRAKSALAETPITRALGVQEILQLIFQHNDVIANQACACVNRSWYNVALDHLWHTVTVLSTLLQILAPMTLTKGRLGHGHDECIVRTSAIRRFAHHHYLTCSTGNFSLLECLSQRTGADFMTIRDA